MNYCNKCGEVLKENAKFCSKCGSLIEFNDKSFIINDEISTIEEEKDPNSLVENNIQDSSKASKINRNNTKIILFAIISVVIISVIGVLGFIKINSNSKQKNQSINIVNSDITNYPNISVTIKADNYSESLKVEDFTIKEKDAFQKDLKLEPGKDENEYIISYKSSDESTSGERNIKIAYLENDKESIAETNYNVPEKNKNNAKTVNSNNAVNTYDNNEISIKQAIDNYENSYIRMVNSKDTYYIKDALDLSGGLLNEFNTMVKSYSEQKIDEDLIKHDIENISKISDTQYEVTNYEKFHIYYGKKNESKYTDFRTTYILNKTSSGFKVYSIKKIDDLGSY